MSADTVWSASNTVFTYQSMTWIQNVLDSFLGSDFVRCRIYACFEAAKKGIQDKNRIWLIVYIYVHLRLKYTTCISDSLLLTDSRTHGDVSTLWLAGMCIAWLGQGRRARHGPVFLPTFQSFSKLVWRSMWDGRPRSAFSMRLCCCAVQLVRLIVVTGRGCRRNRGARCVTAA